MQFITIFTVTCFYFSAFSSANIETPEFDEQMQNVTVSVGRDALFTCTVKHVDHAKVAFVRVDTQTILTIDDVVITRNPRIEIRHFVDSSFRYGASSGKSRVIWQLFVRSVDTSDEGGYMCQLNTEPMTSQIAYLSVTVPPDILVNESSADLTVAEGVNVTLKCAATGQPKPDIVWRREDNLIISKSNFVSEGPFLHLVNVTRYQMAAYLCIASNGVPPSVSKRISFQVKHPPTIVSHKGSVEEWINGTVRLECLCEGFPLPETFWLLNGNYLFPERKSQLMSSTRQGYVTRTELTIEKITKSHQGDYRCFCRNSLGSTDATTKLTILYPLQYNKRRIISLKEKTGFDPSNQLAMTSPLPGPENIQANLVHTSKSSNQLQSTLANRFQSSTTLKPIIKIAYRSSSTSSLKPAAVFCLVLCMFCLHFSLKADIASM